MAKEKTIQSESNESTYAQDIQKVEDIVEKISNGCDIDEMLELVSEAASLPGVRVRGLMAIPPAGAEKADTIRFFSRMTQYFIDMKNKRSDNVTMDYLSMGMSADFADAIRAGANLVRVGSALFGPRVYR